MLELTPELILIIQLVHQLDLNIDNTIPCGGKGLVPLNLLIGKNIILQRFRHLLYHLLDRIARSDSDHQTLADRKIRKLILSHIRQAVDTESNQATNDQDHDLPIVHGPFYSVTFLIHSPIIQNTTFTKTTSRSHKLSAAPQQ